MYRAEHDQYFHQHPIKMASCVNTVSQSQDQDELSFSSASAQDIVSECDQDRTAESTPGNYVRKRTRRGKRKGKQSNSQQIDMHSSNAIDAGGVS